MTVSLNLLMRKFIAYPRRREKKMWKRKNVQRNATERREYIEANSNKSKGKKAQRTMALAVYTGLWTPRRCAYTRILYTSLAQTRWTCTVRALSRFPNWVQTMDRSAAKRTRARKNEKSCSYFNPFESGQNQISREIAVILNGARIHFSHAQGYSTWRRTRHASIYCERDIPPVSHRFHAPTQTKSIRLCAAGRLPEAAHLKYIHIIKPNIKIKQNKIKTAHTNHSLLCFICARVL